MEKLNQGTLVRFKSGNLGVVVWTKSVEPIEVVNTRNVGGYGVSHPYPNKKTKPGYGVINPAPDEEKKENKFKPVKVSRAFKKEGEK